MSEDAKAMGAGMVMRVWMGRSNLGKGINVGRKLVHVASCKSGLWWIMTVLILMIKAA